VALPEGSRRTDWTLTGDALTGLLTFLDADPERAALEYERLRQRLMKLFRWRGCLSFEAYTDETVDRVARMIASGAEIHTSNRYALFHGVAMNLLREHWRDAERQRRAIERMPLPQSSLHPEDVLAQRDEDTRSEARIRCLRGCLQRLPAASLSLIRRYYAEGDVLDKEQRKQIAAELHISASALRVRAHRIRGDVTQCVERCVGRENRS
jgi:DNA-directed RNA polymerase specialized sigma24 family protein